LYNAIADQGTITAGVSSQVNSVAVRIHSIAPNLSVESLESGIDTYLRQGLAWIIGNMSAFFGGVAKILFNLFLMLLALFYFFRDGKKFVSSLVDLSPLKDSFDRHIIKKISLAVTSVIKGHMVIGLVQGMVTGIGFALFGIPSPILWGTIAGIASLAPTVGTSIVLIPGVLFLALSGSTLPAIGLLAWGIFAVGLIDNILGPFLIQRGVHIHSFLIMLSVLGGLALIGPVGFIAGPVALALLFALLDIYPSFVKNTKEEIKEN
jgi:predicted PurR-regulated permease PerM